MSRRRTQLPDKPTTKGPGRELVAWLPFWKQTRRSREHTCVCMCSGCSRKLPSPLLACLYYCRSSLQQKKIPVILHSSCCRSIECLHTICVWTVTLLWGTTIVTLTAVCVVMGCWGPWGNCYNPTETWGHIHLSSSSPVPLLASCWLKHVAATASPPTKQPTSPPLPPVLGNEAGTRRIGLQSRDTALSSTIWWWRRPSMNIHSPRR